MTSTTVRTLQKTDIPALSKLVVCAMPHPWSEKIFYDCVKKHYYGWVLERYSEIVGFVIILLNFSVCELINIAVQPQYQRRGYAQQLLTHALDFAQSRKAKEMLLEVRCSNGIAINLYQKFCAVKIGTRKNYFANGYQREDALIFRIEL